MMPSVCVESFLSYLSRELTLARQGGERTSATSIFVRESLWRAASQIGRPRKTWQRCYAGWCGHNNMWSTFLMVGRFLLGQAQGVVSTVQFLESGTPTSPLGRHHRMSHLCQHQPHYVEERHRAQDCETCQQCQQEQEGWEKVLALFSDESVLACGMSTLVPLPLPWQGRVQPHETFFFVRQDRAV